MNGKSGRFRAVIGVLTNTQARSKPGYNGFHQLPSYPPSSLKDLRSEQQYLSYESLLGMTAEGGFFEMVQNQVDHVLIL